MQPVLTKHAEEPGVVLSSAHPEPSSKAGLIGKMRACINSINANKWPLSQFGLTPPFTTGLLATSQWLESRQEAGRFESGPAASLFRSCSLRLLLSTLPPLSVSTTHDLNYSASDWAKHRSSARKVARSRDGEARGKGLSALPQKAQILSALWFLLNILDFRCKILVLINNFGTKGIQA